MNERWPQLLVVVLLLGQLFLLSSRSPSRGSRAERWMLHATAPLTHGTGRAAAALRGTVDAVSMNGTLRDRNEALTRELETARQALVRLQGVEEELRRLSRTIDYTRRNTGDFFVADVVFVDAHSRLRTLILYTGTSKPQRNQAVRTSRGLVGRIIVTAGRYAKVQLITDRTSSVSAMIERTRWRGMVRGDREGGLDLTLVPRQADVQVGDQVVTAGIDAIYPRGIPIGEVISVTPTSGLFQQVAIRPAIDIARLEQVLVLTAEPVPREMVETNARP